MLLPEALPRCGSITSVSEPLTWAELSTICAEGKEGWELLVAGQSAKVWLVCETVSVLLLLLLLPPTMSVPLN